MAAEETTQLVYQPDHSGVAEGRLLVLWRKPKIRAFCRALGKGAQILEDQDLDLIASTGIDQATGDALDQWGELVGEQRLGLSDTEYRSFVLARMLVNTGDGTIDNMIEILEAAAAPVVRVLHESVFPAGFCLQVERADFMSDEMMRRVARMMTDAWPAGRHMTLIEALDGGFGFDSDTSAEGYGVGPYSRLILAG